MAIKTISFTKKATVIRTNKKRITVHNEAVADLLGSVIMYGMLAAALIFMLLAYSSGQGEGMKRLQEETLRLNQQEQIIEGGDFHE